MDGKPEDALLRQIRLHKPDCATALLWVDRAQVLSFARDACVGFRAVCPGHDGYSLDDDRGPLRAYAGWYAAEWNDIPFEVALVPEWSEPGYALFIATDPASLERVVRAGDDFASRPAGRCLVYAQGWASAPDIDRELGKVTWDDIVLPAAIMALVRDSVEGFLAHREAFTSMGFPWRRGILLVGPPGTGKTMLCRAAASALPDLPFLYVRDLRERNCADSVRAIFTRARRLAPCILAIEDLDGFVDRTNRSVFLNELDGFKNNDGVLIIASTNHPGKIDESLLKRPSRFDRVIHVGLPDLPERREYCRRLLDKPSIRTKLAPGVDAAALAAAVAERSKGFTPAYLKEAFLSAALAHAQRGGGEQLGQDFADGVLEAVDELKRYLAKSKDPQAMTEMRVIGDRGSTIGL